MKEKKKSSYIKRTIEALQGQGMDDNDGEDDEDDGDDKDDDDDSDTALAL